MDWLVEATLNVIEKRWRSTPDETVSWIERVSGKTVRLHLKNGHVLESIARIDTDRQVLCLSFQGGVVEIPI